MPETPVQTLQQRRRTAPGPSDQHQNIPTGQAIENNSARAERARFAKDLLDAIRNYGEKSPRVATILIDLAETCNKLEDYQKQKEYAEKAVEIYRRNYGNNHPETAKAHRKLGNAYLKLKKHEKAKEEYEEALKINKGLKPSDQEEGVEFADLYNNLGNTSYAFKQYQEAETYFNKALSIFRKTEGAESIRLVTVLDNFGSFYSCLKKYEQSSELYKEALLIYKKIYDDSHIEVGQMLRILGNVYYNLAKKESIRNDQKKREYLEQACQYHENAVTIYNKFYGNTDIKAVEALDILADDYRLLGNEEKAEELYRKVLEIHQKSLAVQIKNNPGSIETAKEFSRLGDLYHDLKDFKQAILSYTEALKIKEKLYPKGDDISIASTLQNLGVSYYDLRNYNKAEELYKRALAIQKKHLDPNDPIINETLRVLNIFKAYTNLERLRKTVTEKEKIYDSNSSFANHLQLGQAFRELADAYGVMKDYTNQKFFLEKALPITEERLGDSNPIFTRILKDLAHATKAVLGESAQEVQQLLQEASVARARDDQIALKVKDQRVEQRQKAIHISHTLFHYINSDRGSAEENLKKIRDLVESKSEDINQKDLHGDTPLHLASEARKIEMIKYLIEKGADVNAVNKEGKTPLAVAVTGLCYVNAQDTVLTLLRGGADINALNSDQKQKLISHIEEKGLISYAEEKGYGKPVIDTLSSLVLSFGLFYYAKEGDLEGVKRLVEKGANVNEKDDNGITPLHIAAKEVNVEHTEIIEYLLKNGADPNVQDKEGKTPVYVATARYRSPESLEILLKYGGDPNILDEKGFSLLAEAMQMNRHDMAVILLRNGANVSDLVNLNCARKIQNRDIQNLDSYTKEKGYNDIITMLAPLVKQATKPKPPVRAVLPMPQAGPSQPPIVKVQAHSSNSYDQELKELQDLCGNKHHSSQAFALKAQVPSSQIVQASASKAQVPSSQFAQASVSEAQAHSSNPKLPSKKGGCILM